MATRPAQPTTYLQRAANPGPGRCPPARYVIIRHS